MGNTNSLEREKRRKEIIDAAVNERNYKTREKQKKLKQLKDQIERVVGQTRSISLNPQADLLDVRFFVLHVPQAIENATDKLKTYPLLLFFHGKGDLAWNTVKSTNWIEKANKNEFIVAFGQAKGDLNEEREELVDTFWDLEPKQGEDIVYVHDMIDYISNQFPIDEKRKYIAGFSNGALFATRVGLFYSNEFAAVCSFMGGLHNQGNDSPIESKRKIPFKIITGTEDTMRGHCTQLYLKLKESKYPVEFEEIKGAMHDYIIEKEDEILTFLMKYSL